MNKENNIKLEYHEKTRSLYEGYTLTLKGKLLNFLAIYIIDYTNKKYKIIKQIKNSSLRITILGTYKKNKILKYLQKNYYICILKKMIIKKNKLWYEIHLENNVVFRFRNLERIPNYMLNKYLIKKTIKKLIYILGDEE